MEITEPRRLYQQLAAELKDRIEQGVYLVGDKLPAERFIADEKSVSRTVVREAIIMLEVEGYVEVRKGSGIHVISSQPKYSLAPDESLEFASYGPFELLQARQLIESNIADQTGHHEADGDPGERTQGKMFPRFRVGSPVPRTGGSGYTKHGAGSNCRKNVDSARSQPVLEEIARSH